MILKKDKKTSDINKSNTVIRLSNVVKVGDEAGFADNSAFSVTLKESENKIVLQCKEQEERDLWMTMFEYIIAVNENVRLNQLKKEESNNHVRLIKA